MNPIEFKVHTFSCQTSSTTGAAHRYGDVVLGRPPEPRERHALGHTGPVERRCVSLGLYIVIGYGIWIGKYILYIYTPYYIIYNMLCIYTINPFPFHIHGRFKHQFGDGFVRFREGYDGSQVARQRQVVANGDSMGTCF